MIYFEFIQEKTSWESDVRWKISKCDTKIFEKRRKNENLRLSFSSGSWRVGVFDKLW